jgi:hypothetical protein
LAGHSIGDCLRAARAGSDIERQRLAQLPRGQVVWVSVTTQYSASATFYSGTASRYTDLGGYNHAFNYGTRTANWRVTSSGNILTVSDWCGGNVTAAHV